MTSTRAADRLRVLALVAGAGLSAAPFVPAPLALALGAFVGLVLGNPRPEWSSRLAPILLAGSLVGVGAGVDLRDIASIGARGAALTLVTVATCLALGYALARVLRLETKLAVLVAVGTAICGGTAIAAMVPLVRARRDQTTVALGTVFVLNAVAMVVLPFIGRALGLGAESFGTLAALAVHDTSAVVGAASSFGERAVEIATTIKLARATLLVPVAFGVAALMREPATAKGERAPRIPVPWFVVGFLAASALVTIAPVLAPVGEVAAVIARRTMVVALYLVAAGASREALRRTGVRPLVLGTVLWVVVAAVSIVLVTR